MTSLRLLMTVDAVGGVWTYACELGQALAARGVRTAFAVLGPPPSDEQRARVRAIPGARLFEHPGRLEWMDDPWGDVRRSGDWLLELGRRTAPDLVHLNGYAHASLPWSVPRLVAGHSCVLSWWRAVKGRPAPRSRYGRYRAAVREGLHAADAVVTPTAAFGRELVRHYGAPRLLRTIPNGRRPTDFACRRKEDFVLAAGRLWDEAKNFDLLRRVAPRLSVPVYAAGERRSADARGVTELGRLPAPQLAEWYGRAAVFAHPARYEPFGLAPLEAALGGCALVLGDIASLREVWGGSATYVDPDDPEELRGAIERLFRLPARRRRLGARARRQALRYGPGRLAQAYLSLYEELVGVHAPPPDERRAGAVS